MEGFFIMRGLEELRQTNISETPSSTELKVLLYQFLGDVEEPNKTLGKMLGSLQPDVQPDRGDLTSFALQGVAIRTALHEAIMEIIQEKKADPRYRIDRTPTERWEQDITISHATPSGKREITTTQQLNRDRLSLPLHILLTSASNSSSEQSQPAKIISLADFASRRATSR